MMDSYKVGYSVDALDDLREIYSYIANELLVSETATVQLGRIRKEVRSLDFMPARYALVRLGTLAFDENASASGRQFVRFRSTQ